MALGATLARCRRCFSAWACWALTPDVLTTSGLAASRLPAADLTQAFRVLAVALVPASRLVLASASFAQADPRARSPASGQTAVALRNVKGAHGSGNSQGKSSGRMHEHSLRAHSKLETNAGLPVYRLLENKTVETKGLVGAPGTRHPVKRCLSNDRLLENKTERQTVSSTRWEQEPGALPVERSEALPNQRSAPIGERMPRINAPSRSQPLF